MPVWLLSGNQENWERAVSGTMWGVVEKKANLWKALEKNDLLVFYCSKPVSGIIGISRVGNKFIEDEPYWSEEVAKGRVIWKYRFEFTPLYILPRHQWVDKAVRMNLGKLTIAGITPIRDESLVRRIFENLEKQWNINIEELQKIKTLNERISSHEEAKEFLLELGKFGGYIVEQELKLPDLNERLDVVWRRVSAGVPTYVFEVHRRGNLHQALTKLKHSFDLWNSNIYLVCDEKLVNEVKDYLEGAFHEIKQKIRILTFSKLQQLYNIQKKDYELKTEVGLR